jgi:fructose-1,6-bisphosphatase/inositol monophosphatase family enzyme
MKTTLNLETLLPLIKKLHETIRDGVVEACERSATTTLAAVAREEEGDTIYAVDRVGEDLLVDFFEREIASQFPVVLIAEGLPDGKIVLPRGASEREAVLRIIVDPIDGTRGLMYQKRSAWVLTAVAPNRGPHTSLRDVVLAVQTEIPLVKQHLSDQLWAIRGEGAQARRYNRLTGQSMRVRLTPSTASSIAHGYSSITRFFPGARDVLAALDDAIVLAALGPPAPGKAACFEDQYTSTGGQLYELMAGHDRFVADLRPLVRPLLAERKQPPALSCHPYDVCCALIAEESGVIVTDVHGAPLDLPLNVDADVAWVGYANARIQALIEPILQKELRERGLFGRHP